MDAPESHEDKTLWARWVRARALRWGAIASLLYASVVALSVDGLFEVCEDQLAQTGEKAVVEVCRAPSAGDPIVLGFFLLILVFLWPDISQISFGVLSLTTKVEEQAKKTEKLSTDVGDLRHDFSQQMLMISRHVQNVATAVSQDVSSQLRASQSQFFAPSNAFSPQIVFQQPPLFQPDRAKETVTAIPSQEASVESVLAPVRNQPAYVRIGLPDAWRAAEDRRAELVRVVIVGAAPDARLQDIKGLGSHLEPRYVARGVEPGTLVHVGNASASHVLAIAPSAVISPVEVLDSGGGSRQAMYEGMIAAVSQRPQVLVLGVGGGDPIPEIEALLLERSADLVVVAPAGTTGQSTAVWPAIIPGVIAVAAVTEDGERASFSNYGVGVDLSAPGTGINSLTTLTSDGALAFREVSGTSVAADIVAGIAALLLSTGKIAPAQILDLLRRTASDTTAGQPPVVNAAAAMRLLLSDAPS